MDTTVSILAIFTFLWNHVESVPPEACFANFRWDDCGYPPEAVLYYYKPGSRCEVGYWRGCLPNPNMFKDEYECVNTCVFSIRAQPEDYHNANDIFPAIDDKEIIEPTTESDSSTPTATEDANSTDTTGHTATEGGEGRNASEVVTSGDDAVTSGGDTVTSGGDAVTSRGDAVTSGGDVNTSGDQATTAKGA